MSVGVKIGRFAGLVLVTLLAGAVMLASGFGLGGGGAPETARTPVQDAPPAPVSILHAQRMPLAITDVYSGMIRPWERFRVGFDIAGRVEQLGRVEPSQVAQVRFGPALDELVAGAPAVALHDAESLDEGESLDKGEPLDEGDRVRQGQVLAVLDRRHLEARQREASAMLRKAQDEFDRARQLRDVNERAISDAALLARETDFEVARAQLELAEKQLDDAVLRAPADGIISRRLVNTGESVLPQQTAFEIVQVDRVLLVVGVPESRVRPLVQRQRDVQRSLDDPDVADEAFLVEVELVGRDSLGRRWEPVPGVVHDISQTADETSGMFEVEVSVDNPRGDLRPGQIGIARLVVAEVNGFRVPHTAGVVREDSLVLFYAKHQGGEAAEGAPAQVGEELVADTLELRAGSYVEQEDDLVLLDLPTDARNVIVRGQHRLVAGSAVVVTQITGAPDASSSGAEARLSEAPVGATRSRQDSGPRVSDQ